MISKRITIPRHIDDPFYRYVMPELIVSLSAVTKLVNVKEVASSLRVPPEYILKFFAYELSTAHDDKKFELKGRFNRDELLLLLDKFIEKYIICPKCKYPETKLIRSKKGISSACYSCGWTGMVDNKHKISSYIMKFPTISVREMGKEEKKIKEEKICEDLKDENSDDEWDS